MSMIKQKPDKIKYLNPVNTLDTEHRKHVSQFETKRQTVDDIRTELKMIESKLFSLDKILFNLLHRIFLVTHQL